MQRLLSIECHSRLGDAPGRSRARQAAFKFPATALAGPSSQLGSTVDRLRPPPPAGHPPPFRFTTSFTAAKTISTVKSRMQR